MPASHDSTPSDPPSPASTPASAQPAAYDADGAVEADFRRGIGRWLVPAPGGSPGGCLGGGIALLIFGGVAVAALFSYLVSHLH
jgi:hypothetical protein